MQTPLLAAFFFVFGIILLMKWSFDSEAKDSTPKDKGTFDHLEDYYNDKKNF